ncbi:hypothetical protein AB0K86_26050 [Streptomyces clavifer]|uniref:hypothetical protein n=1 Tax=Streptomyces TaxID=1883 RepID=UPI0006FF7160|nr:hypothetical protein [Streptomyces sp. Root55]KQZ19786.1 hypothetical protein ASD51_26095 [Streptomyces sp. Root55]
MLNLFTLKDGKIIERRAQKRRVVLDLPGDGGGGSVWLSTSTDITGTPSSGAVSTASARRLPGRGW